jgi:death on curing protein
MDHRARPLTAVSTAGNQACGAQSRLPENDALVLGRLGVCDRLDEAGAVRTRRTPRSSLSGGRRGHRGASRSTRSTRRVTEPVEYLDVDDILGLAQRLLGTPIPIRDVGLLGSAVARPQTSVDGSDAYPDMWTKAVALLQSIVNNHALIDGNKRLGWLATAVFLELNGIEITAAADNGVYDLVIECITPTEHRRHRRPPYPTHPRAARVTRGAHGRTGPPNHWGVTVRALAIGCRTRRIQPVQAGLAGASRALVSRWP